MPQILHNPTRLLGLAFALGLVADQLFYKRAPGVSLPLFVALGLLTLSMLAVREQRRPIRANLWLGASALFFAICVAWRSAPELRAFNILVTGGLLLYVAANYRGNAFEQLDIEQLLGQLIATPLEIAFHPFPVVWDSAHQVRFERDRRWFALARGLLLALPVLCGFTILLTAADSIFNSYVSNILDLKLPFNLGEAVKHMIFTCFVAWICAGGLLVALRSDTRSSIRQVIEGIIGAFVGLVYIAPEPTCSDLPAEGATQTLKASQRPLIRLGWIEALTILTTVDLLFGSFMLIQAAYLFGGLDTLNRTNMTYAEYARSGFFELILVAFIALALLCGLAVVTQRDEQRQRTWFNIASSAMIALVVGMLVSAFTRMWLYEQAYGFTQLRLYTHSFMIWLAVLLGIFLLALLRNRPRLFTFGGIISALIFLAVLNIINPDALIARENIAWYRSGDKLDVYYLTQLSPDATPTLVDALPQLNAPEQAKLLEALELQHTDLAHDLAWNKWPSWQLGRVRALIALEQAGIGQRAPDETFR